MYWGVGGMGRGQTYVDSVLTPWTSLTSILFNMGLLFVSIFSTSPLTLINLASDSHSLSLRPFGPHLSRSGLYEPFTPHLGLFETRLSRSGPFETHLSRSGLFNTSAQTHPLTTTFPPSPKTSAKQSCPCLLVLLK
jgi:hypothetical protein